MYFEPSTLKRTFIAVHDFARVPRVQVYPIERRLRLTGCLELGEIRAFDQFEALRRARSQYATLSRAVESGARLAPSAPKGRAKTISG